MQNKMYWKKRLNLLIISLEALSTYQSSSCLEEIKYLQYRCNKNVSTISTKFFHIKNYSQNSFIQQIIDIFIIYINICKNSPSTIATKILTDYAKNKSSHDMAQYVKKFKYIYSIRNEYYIHKKSNSFLYHKETNKIAITTLYLLTKLTKKQGLYFLIKYLDI
uniref:Uncharacterized protein n=1 Tax=Alsidium seaforthii TaxID=2007182 RepID=A0A1Z1MDE5_9FLOR|nr:hypothetical protein [Bryothamnion seaforthii]ARW64040.1 hypothetical protein [Bryothamnion seaforthii]